MPCLHSRPMAPHHSTSIEEHALNSGDQCKCRLHRLVSYGSWPHLSRQSARAFAAAGFYYVGRGDEVRCAACGLTLAQWTSGVVQPLVAHRTLCTSACQFAYHRPPLVYSAHARDNVQQLLPDVTSGALETGGVSGSSRSTVAGREDGNDSSSAAIYRTTAADTAASQLDRLFVACFCKLFADLLPSLSVRLNDMLKTPTVADPAAGNTSPSQGSNEQQLLLPKPREEAVKYEVYRLRTFSDVWNYSHIVDPRELAQAGFYYAGPRDRVQCAFCQGLLRNWEPGDRAMSLHMQHFTYCRFVQGHDVGNVPIPFSSLQQTWPEHEGEVEEVLGISRSTPNHGDLAVEARRLATFATWPSVHHLKPDDLARAGFFYIGGHESVKCFYCDVVISAWPTGSDAWVEHAKHSSSCLYLEQIKGVDFVQQHRVANSRADGSSPRTSYTVDPREIRARLDTSKVRILLRMEYPMDLVREAVLQRLSTVSDDHVSPEDLLASMFDLHDSRQRSQLEADRPANPVTLPVVITAVGSHSDSVSHSAATSNHASSVPALPIIAGRQSLQLHAVAVAASSHGTSHPELFSNRDLQPRPLSPAGTGQHHKPSSLKPASAEEENRQLKTQLTCKICMDSLVGIVFLPCGHFVCCPACAPALTSCPICRVSVRGTVRTHI